MPHLGEFTKKKHSSLTAQADLHAPKLHASNHENGGVDEIDLTGLSGAYDIAQLKIDHPTLTGSELHDPKAHKTSHEDGGLDEISLSGLSGQQIMVPYNGKIADIKEADTNKYYLTLANAGGTGAIAGETRKIIAVIIRWNRASGTGNLNFYPNEGTYVAGGSSSTTVTYVIIIADGTQRLQYSQSVANDDWDLYCLGYVVEA